MNNYKLNKLYQLNTTFKLATWFLVCIIFFCKVYWRHHLKRKKVNVFKSLLFDDNTLFVFGATCIYKLCTIRSGQLIYKTNGVILDVMLTKFSNFSYAWCKNFTLSQLLQSLHRHHYLLMSYMLSQWGTFPPWRKTCRRNHTQSQADHLTGSCSTFQREAFGRIFIDFLQNMSSALCL